MQTAPVTDAQSAPPDQLIVRGPPRWEDVPRPFRTAAEDCVWDYVDERVGVGREQIAEAFAEQIGNNAVEACAESIAVWVDKLNEREARHGELRRFTNSRVQEHIAVRAKEFALGVSERFYIDEDRGEDTRPSFQMSYTCEARMRRAQQLSHNVNARVDEVRAEFSDVPMEERDSLQNSAAYLELVSDIEMTENRIRLIQRRCPQFIQNASDRPAQAPKEQR